MRNVKSLVVTFGALAMSAMVSAFQPVPNLLRWTVRLPDADALLPTPRAYRLYASTDAVRLAFTLSNESAAPLVIDLPHFSQNVVATVRSESELPASARWEQTLRRSGDGAPHTVAAVPSIQLDPGAGLEWAMAIQRTDGMPFAAGEYDIQLILERALSAITNIDGSAWKGRALPHTVLRLVVRSADSSVERTRMHWNMGVIAVAENRSADAIEHFRAALRESPDDVSAFAGLGNAYLMQNRYREAIDAYERAWPRLARAHSGVPMSLALAYLGVGDEPNARRVLTNGGRTDAEIAAQVRDLREQVSRRARR
jgi:tetratricopeptide (TPR) repeat protein